MPDLNAGQLQEITYVSGVDAGGIVASDTYWTWAQQQAHDNFAYAAKWGADIGSGALVSVYFDTASHWSGVEQNALTAAMDMWSAIANIKFAVTTNAGFADVTVERGNDGTAQGGIVSLDPGEIGTRQIGHADEGNISIDTSVFGFGPISGNFATAGGYVWQTMLHEWGHIVGLGHGGAYDSTQGDETPQHGGYDNRAWSIMSYIDAGDGDFPQSTLPSGGVDWGSTGTASSGFYDGQPTTWMPLDIVAAQRLYGVAADSPLSNGGQVFGFHSNIAGDIHNFFDFTVNAQPVVTIWDGGSHNTLDLSGFSNAANISIEAGSFSSAGGLTNNIAIAFGTHVETAITGGGNDVIHGNDLSDVLMGGAGQDRIIGGAGNDHIYGNMLSGVAGATDGADTIDVGAGMNYANGNAGNDTIIGGDGPNRLLGGQGDDQITAGNGKDSVNGNLGNDIITVGNGNDTVRGGQGDDVIRVGSGNDVIQGDLGNDTLHAGIGHDVMTGGSGADIFDFGSRPGSAMISEITDFDGVAGDRISIGSAISAGHILYDPGVDLVSEALAAQTAAGLIGTQTGMVAALQVGSDAYLFFNSANIGNVIQLDGIAASSIDSNDFAIVG